MSPLILLLLHIVIINITIVIINVIIIIVIINTLMYNHAYRDKFAFTVNISSNNKDNYHHYHNYAFDNETLEKRETEMDFLIYQKYLLEISVSSNDESRIL